MAIYIEKIGVWTTSRWCGIRSKTQF